MKLLSVYCTIKGSWGTSGAQSEICQGVGAKWYILREGEATKEELASPREGGVPPSKEKFFRFLM